MAKIWEKAISILAENLNLGHTYLSYYNCSLWVWRFSYVLQIRVRFLKYKISTYDNIWTVSPNLSNVPFPRFQLQPTSSCSPWRSLRLTRAFDCGGFSAKTYCDEVFDKIFHCLIFVRTGKDSLEKWLKLWITSNHFGLTWGPRSKLALFLTSSSRVAKYFSRCF